MWNSSAEVLENPKLILWLVHTRETRQQALSNHAVLRGDAQRITEKFISDIKLNMPRNKSIQETGLAKAKQFYLEQLAKHGTPVKEAGLPSAASTKMTNQRTKRFIEGGSHQSSTNSKCLKKAAIREINAVEFRNRESKIHLAATSTLQYSESELARKAERDPAALQCESDSVGIDETLIESDDVPLLVGEANHSYHAWYKEHPAICGHAKTETAPNRTSQSLNKSSTTKSNYFERILVEVSLVIPWVVGLFFALLAIRFEQPILLFIASLRFFMWKLMRVSILAALLAMGVHLIVWLVRRVRILQYNRHLEFWQQVLNVKMNVHKILQSDPDTGVTVDSLRDELMEDMKRRTFDKVWKEVVSDIQADYRVAKFVGGDWGTGKVEEVWQWRDAPLAGQRDANRLRRVVVPCKPGEHTE